MNTPEEMDKVWHKLIKIAKHDINSFSSIREKFEDMLDDLNLHEKFGVDGEHDPRIDKQKEHKDVLQVSKKH